MADKNQDIYVKMFESIEKYVDQMSAQLQERKKNDEAMDKRLRAIEDTLTRMEERDKLQSFQGLEQKVQELSEKNTAAINTLSNKIERIEEQNKKIIELEKKNVEASKEIDDLSTKITTLDTTVKTKAAAHGVWQKYMIPAIVSAVFWIASFFASK